MWQTIRNLFRKRNLLRIRAFAYEMWINDDVPVTVLVTNFTYDPETKKCDFTHCIFDAGGYAVDLPESIRDELYRDIVTTAMQAIGKSLNES